MHNHTLVDRAMTPLIQTPAVFSVTSETLIADITASNLPVLTADNVQEVTESIPPESAVLEWGTSSLQRISLVIKHFKASISSYPLAMDVI